MKNFPNPKPDRRVNISEDSEESSNTATSKYAKYGGIRAYYKAKNGTNFKNDLYDIKDGNMSLVKVKHIETMRMKIINYKLCADKILFLNNSALSRKLTKTNIILFGPSGSGKSSFIKSLYRALYNTPILPPDAMKRLVIKGKYQNEGTLFFTQLHLVEQHTRANSGIILCDTRGHVKMNEDETEQFKVMIEGKVKDGMLIKQRTERNPFALWEFWKKDSELFPTEIFKAENPGIDSIPHTVVFVFDGSADEVIQKEDVLFYRTLVDISKNKGYFNLHVILTRIDVFEEKLKKYYGLMNESDRNIKINSMKDSQIQKVIEILGVNRSNIHFIENYHGEENNKSSKNNMEIDYDILKTLLDLLNAGEYFVINYLNKMHTGLATCFRGKLLY